ncbi:MAG: hypothetical protein JXQ75_08825 [Phycisphaerae bacterium]|nr:hypothetical protein [Phycisphaerae bacterium]
MQRFINYTRPLSATRWYIMESWKDLRIREIEARAEREAAYLAGEFARAASEERELILAALEGERWLAESCQDILENRGPP